MASLTITVDVETLERARSRATERGESVDQVLVDRLREYAQDDDYLERQRRTADRLTKLARKYPGGSGGRRWTREELYAERLDRYPKQS